MDNLEKSVPNFEGFDISGNTQLPGNILFNNDKLISFIYIIYIKEMIFSPIYETFSFYVC